ncbi:MAG: flagellar hook-associated protein FlgK [Rickettsiales bacterium]|nr:flagellar hook-associated protein FlgK [Rickettsiales bacterium]
MSLTLALNNALTGLNANQKALSVVSNNIANANTEGYSRQIVQQSALYIGTVGSGVRIEDITRNVDKYLQRSLISQSSEVGQADAINIYHERIQVLLGKPGANNSIDEYIGEFFSSIQSLADSPERISFRENAVNSGVVLSREISSLAEGLEDLRLQTDQDIKEGIRAVNLELQTIDSLNIAINNAVAIGNPTAGLMDQMDLALDKISDYMEISTYTQPNGSIYVYSGSGIPLVDDSLYQIRYRPASGIESFIEDRDFSAIESVRINENGTDSNDKTVIFSAGNNENVVSNITSGRLLGLQQLRDKIIPDILLQLDNIASVVRDTFNAIHNDGSSYPGTDELTGTRSVLASDRSDWKGTVRIAALDGEGKPITSPYNDESYTGIRPLDLDLTFLESGFGKGQPTVQTIVDEINNHFYPPPVKSQVGNLNNIQLVSNSTTIPNIPPQFTFDFDLDNISKTSSQFFVTNVQVFDDSTIPANITNVSAATRPLVTLDVGAEYTTTAGSGQVRVNAVAHGLKDGGIVYLSNPGGAVDGIAAATLTGFFTVTNATTDYFEVITTGAATAGGVQAAITPGVTATPKWDEIAAGDRRRTRDNGTITVDFTANTAAGYYDIVLDVGVYDGTTAPELTPTSQITYRIFNNTTNLLNDRYNSTAQTGNGTRVVGSTSQPSLIAKLVDEKGVELAKTNGVYEDRPSFLKLETFNPVHTVALDELDSQQLGITTTVPTSAGTNRGFSHYFELNNFFESNIPTTTGDTKKNSAINLKVEDRFSTNANLVSLGTLAKTPAPTDPDAEAQYTYERNIASNDVVQRLARLGLTELSFDAAGGLASATQTISGYSAEILGFVASNATQADSNFNDSLTIKTGFEERLDSLKGVNIDEELANTILYQNAYTASARIVSIVDELFQTLIGLGQ